MDTKEKRELYKAMRSAHDGICPTCGGSCEARPARCRNRCGFYLTEKEDEEILSWHEDFHSNLPQILAKYRGEAT